MGRTLTRCEGPSQDALELYIWPVSDGLVEDVPQTMRKTSIRLVSSIETFLVVLNRSARPTRGFGRSLIGSKGKSRHRFRQSKTPIIYEHEPKSAGQRRKASTRASAMASPHLIMALQNARVKPFQSSALLRKVRTGGLIAEQSIDGRVSRCPQPKRSSRLPALSLVPFDLNDISLWPQCRSFRSVSSLLHATT